MIPYPAHLSEPEIQARLLSCLLLLGYDARAEVRDGPAESRKGARYDIVIFLDREARAIVEVKRDRPVYAADIETKIAYRESTQRRKYVVSNLPVLVCRGLSGVSHTLKCIQTAISLPEEFPMQRFTETTQWDKPWFQALPAGYKLLWKYLNDKADQAGVWSVNHALAEFQISLPLDFEHLPPTLEARIVRLDETRWLLPEWIGFQRKDIPELNPEVPVHSGHLKALAKHGLSYANGVTVQGIAKVCPRNTATATATAKKKRSVEGKHEPDPEPLPTVAQLRADLRKRDKKAFKVQETLWRKCLETLREHIDPENHSVWISSTVYLGHTANVLYLAAPSDFNARWVQRNYAERIARVFAHHARLKAVSASCLVAEIPQ